MNTTHFHVHGRTAPGAITPSTPAPSASSSNSLHSRRVVARLLRLARVHRLLTPPVAERERVIAAARRPLERRARVASHTRLLLVNRVRAVRTRTSRKRLRAQSSHSRPPRPRLELTFRGEPSLVPPRHVHVRIRDLGPVLGVHHAPAHVDSGQIVLYE